MLANYLADDSTSGELARRAVAEAGDVAVPDLADIETVAVLRKRWMAGAITDNRFSAAVDILAQLPLRRFPAVPLLRRAYELRSTVTAYDAVYIALAEALDCGLLTADARLARAPGPRCPILLLER